MKCLKKFTALLLFFLKFSFLDSYLARASTVYFSQDAINHAQTATLIQTGIQKKIDEISSYSEGRAKYYIQKLHIEPEVAIIGVGYKVYKTRTISFKLMNKNINISPDFVNQRYSIGVSWSW